jgi:tripartite-type tricarboxylate transporter receptor subunit TctC
MLRVNAGIDIVHVPYKGAAPAMNAVLAGEVSMFCGPITQGLAHVKGGKLKAIGVTGSSISGLVPELPTLSTTIPGLVVSSTYMVYAPPATPANIAQLIKTDLRKTWEDKDVRERLGAMGMDLIWLEGAELTRRVDADLAKWSNVVKTAGIRAE